MAKQYFGSHQFNDPVVGVAATLGSHFATKSQLDAVANGRTWKNAVRVVATSNLDISGGALVTNEVVDGVTLALGDRVLVTAQSTASQNGIYLVAASGAASRAADLAATSNAAGFVVQVNEGTVYADTRWQCTSNDGSAVVGSDSLTITQDTVGGSYTADDTTLELTGSEFSIKDGGVGTTQLASNAVTAAKLADECKGFEDDVGDGAATSFNVDHNLNTRKLHVTVYDNATYTTAECVVTRSTVNRVVVDFGGYTPSSDEFHVLITPWL